MRLDSPLTQSGALSKNIAEKAYTIKVIHKENHMQNYSANDILTIICGSIFRNTYINYFLTFLKVKKILFSVRPYFIISNSIDNNRLNSTTEAIIEELY